MITVFLPQAADEAKLAALNYEARRPGLADQFALELDAAIQRIERNPASWTRVGPNLHKRRLDRYPYTVIYAIEDNGIVIAAVAHDRRRPGYWRDRV